MIFTRYCCYGHVMVRRLTSILSMFQVDRAVLRPSGIFYDRESSDLYVSNFAEGSVVCYRLQTPAT